MSLRFKRMHLYASIITNTFLKFLALLWKCSQENLSFLPQVNASPASELLPHLLGGLSGSLIILLQKHNCDGLAVGVGVGGF